MSLKVKVQLGEDMRVFKEANFSDLEAGYERFRLFIKESFDIADLKEFLIQYKDEENDLITITSKDDLNDVIKQSIKDKKSLKLFIKPKKKQTENKVEEVEDEEDEEDDEEEAGLGHLTGNFFVDISNNEKFREEFVLFLKEIVLKYQENKEKDLISCISTALSSHQLIRDYGCMEEILRKLKNVVPPLAPLVGPFVCDGCNCKIEKDSPAWGCRLCDYDLCVPCFSSNFVGRRGCRRGCRRWRRHGPHGGRRKWMQYCVNNNDNDNDNDNENCSRRRAGYRIDIISNPLPLLPNGKVDSNEEIVKRWKLKNVGEIALPKGLIVKYQGRKCNPMVTKNEFMVGNSQEIKPNEEFSVSVSVNAPNDYGKYASNWRLFTPEGKRFGVRLPFNLVLMPQAQDSQENDKINVPQEQNELKQDIENETATENENEEGIDMLISDEDTPQIAYKYEKELENLKLMGFGYGDNFLKQLLNTHQGRLNDVLRVLLPN